MDATNKALIITLPLGGNYGGIMQAFALQKFMSQLGYKCETTSSPFRSLQESVKKHPLVRKIAKKKPLATGKFDYKTRLFIENRIETINFGAACTRVWSQKYSILIAGSDQVWRQTYGYIPHYLFSFAPPHSPKRISYAASFGKVNIPENAKIFSRKSQKLVARFDSISVRESSGVNIVHSGWNLDAEQHVDPTLLLGIEDYLELIDNPVTELSNRQAGSVFAYVLDVSLETSGIVQEIESMLGMKSHKLIEGVLNQGSSLPPVEEWLREFKKADFVITDSFHGTVFSIIFKKPFIAVGNQNRGITRFESLLSNLGLSDRLVTSPDQVTEELVHSQIDWLAVQKVIDSEIARSRAFLSRYLK